MNYQEKIIQYYKDCHIDYRILLGANKYYNMHYGFYDAEHQSLSSALSNLNRVLAEMAHIKKGETVLDAGCGVGGSAIWTAKNIGTRVTGITLSDDQRKLAEKFAQKENLNNLTKFITGDFLHMPFPDESFDVVWTIESTCYAPDRKDFLREAKRVLKRGTGRVIIADGFTNKEKFTPEEQKIMNTFLSGWVVQSPTTIEAFKKYLTELGFHNIVFENANSNILPFSKFLYRWGMIMYPINKILQWLRIRNKYHIGDNRAAIEQYRALCKNLWTYGIFYAEK